MYKYANMHFYSHIILAPGIGVQMNKNANKKFSDYKYTLILLQLTGGNYDLLKPKY